MIIVWVVCVVAKLAIVVCCCLLRACVCKDTFAHQVNCTTAFVCKVVCVTAAMEPYLLVRRINILHAFDSLRIVPELDERM